MEVAKALRIEVDECDECSETDTTNTASANLVTTTVQKVQCDPSPFFFAFYHHHICKVVVDSDATSSMLSRAFLILAGISFVLTGHSVTAVNNILFISRELKRLAARFFSAKLKEHQIGWMPCEHEALAIASSVNHFSPYIRDAKEPTQVLTDSRPCVLAYHKMCKGQFSASARVSTFLSTLSTSRVTLNHIKGEHNIASDFASRHPQHCASDNCQVCNFVMSLLHQLYAK